MLFWTPHFPVLDSTFFVLDSTFWLDSTLKIDPAFKVTRRHRNHNSDRSATGTCDLSVSNRGPACRAVPERNGDFGRNS